MSKRKYIRDYNYPPYSKKKQKNNDDEDPESDEEKEVPNNIVINLAGLAKRHTNEHIDNIGNIIWFNCGVTKETVNKLIKLIYHKNMEYRKTCEHLSDYAKLEPQPLYLHINSYGGSLHATMAAIDAIRNSEIPIYTVIEGCAASAGTLISIAGKKRFITENSIMLIHQLSSGIWGKMAEIEDDYTNCKFFMKKIKKLYTTYTHLKEKQLNEMLKHDLWWDAKTCLKHGLVDEIIQQ